MNSLFIEMTFTFNFFAHDHNIKNELKYIKVRFYKYIHYIHDKRGNIFEMHMQVKERKSPPPFGKFNFEI